MNTRLFGKIVAIILVSIGIMLGLVIAFLISGDEKSLPKGLNETKFQMPSFISSAEASEPGALGFPENEAGICAYVKLDSIDIDKAKNYITEQIVEENYIIGTKEVNSTKEEWAPHIYANTDGWVIAYIPLNRPESFIVGIESSSTPYNPTITTALFIFCRDYGKPIEYGMEKYYHFQYPDAVGFVMVYEKGDSRFFITIPESIEVLSNTFIKPSGSHYIFLNESGTSASLPTYYGDFYLPKGVENSIRGSSTTRIGIVIVYR